MRKSADLCAKPMSGASENRSDRVPSVGDPVNEVPEKSPDEYCNARTTEDGKFQGYCGEPAGEGTDNDVGRCWKHGGASTGGKDEEAVAEAVEIGGANTRTHGLTVDPHNYIRTLDSAEEKQFVLNVQSSIEDRIERNTGDLDFLDQALANRVAVMLHIACQAAEYANREGLFEQIFTPDGQIEVENRMLDHIRQYNKDLVRILRDIGATKDTQDELSATAMWRSQLEDSE